MAYAVLNEFAMQTQLPRNCTFTRSDWDVLAQFWHPVAFSTEVGADPFRRHAARPTARPLPPRRRHLVLHRSLSPSRRSAEHGLGPGQRHRLQIPRLPLRASAASVSIFPAHPGAAIPPKLCLKSYPTIEKFGLVWTCLTAGVPAKLPSIPEWDDPTYQHIFPNSIEMEAAAGRQVEGFLDVAHFAWIHTESFGSRDNPVVPRYDVEVRPEGLHIEYRSTVSNYPKSMQGSVSLPPDYLWLRVFDVTYPFSARLTVFFPGEGRLVILNAACPISARKTRIFVPICTQLRPRTNRSSRSTTSTIRSSRRTRKSSSANAPRTCPSTCSRKSTSAPIARRSNTARRLAHLVWGDPTRRNLSPFPSCPLFLKHPFCVRPSRTRVRSRVAAPLSNPTGEFSPIIGIRSPSPIT